jgi:hexosaminidase
MMRNAIFICILVAGSALTLAQTHNPVLPKLQKVTYGKNQLLLKGLSIGFASAPADEDWFAAQELATALSEITSSRIPVKGVTTKGSSIILERTGAIDPLPVPDEKSGPGSRESYKITINTKGVRISAPSSAGLFYGVQTLRQMVEESGEMALLPEAEVEDWPSLAYRSFMMDMSHAQLPRIDELKRQIDFLSRWKANQYLFYSEASIELDGYPLLMANARFTKAQVKEVIEYAKARHVDVVPNMELYGHLHDLFRLEHYADLSVIPHGGEFQPKDPRVKPLLEDWIGQISAVFSSPFFHIGFDETWLLEVEAKKLNKPPEELYLEMLKQTTDIVEKNGKRPLVWADMLQKFPSIVPKVSPKMIAVPWHYFPLSEAEYDKLLSPFSKAGVSTIVQGASLNWDWLVPDFEISFKNTDLLIAAGRKYNTMGYITSGWTDDTQTLMRLAFPDLAYGAAASWQSVPVDHQTFFRDLTHAQYPAGLAIHMEKAYQSLMEAENTLVNMVGSTDPAFWANPFTKDNLKMISENKENLRKGRLLAEEAQMQLLEAMKYGTDTSTLFILYTGARLLDYLAMKYLYAGEIEDFWNQVKESENKSKVLGSMYSEISSKYHTRTSDMLDAISEAKELFQKAWLYEYTPFRLGVALGKYDAEFQFWLRLKQRLETFNQYYKEGDPLPTLESIAGD